MSRVALFVVVCVAITAFVTTVGTAGILDDPDLIWKRGDTNNDGSVNGTDVMYLSNWLYSGGPTPPCMNQADVNDDGSVNGADPVYLSNWLFNGGSEPPAPGPSNPYCLSDPTTPNLGCSSYYCP